jgi:hypothetical protein
VVWVIAFESAEQAAAFANVLPGAVVAGTVVVLVSGVPPGHLEAVRAAALRVY